MTIYILLIFIALCIGMAISVHAFGTGGKRKHIFRDIYFSVENTDGIGIIYTKTGEYSAILKIENPVQKYSANTDSYYEFTHLFSAIAQTLGEGYAIHKQDIFIRKQFEDGSGDQHEFLSAAYFRYFNGRHYTDSVCYLTITQESKKSRLFSFDNKKWRDFLVKIRKVHDLLHDAGVQAVFLNETEASRYVDRFFAMDFKNKTVSMTNFKASDENLSMGDKRCKVYSLVDVDCVSLPSLIRPYSNIEVNNSEMPVDLLSAIDSIPNAETVVYNQIIFLPNQKRELALLDKKKNRHASIPNPGNQMAVEDIKRVQEVIARESKQLVYTHYNLIVSVPADTDLQKCTNHLENTFSRLGIHISKRAYNQLELFVSSFPGNCYSMSEDYDRFLTLSDAAMCLMYKERIQHSEETPLKIYYTDRQGVPVAIDITGKEGKYKLTDNSNFFCLGPSGSGKSFHMNSVVRQLYEQGTDVVMVDTGNSYEGLCEYLNGKYISYTEEKPITMNPFRINRAELNVEKTGFLKNLVLLIWKGSQGTVTKTEDRLIEQVITEYYDTYFNGFEGFSITQREDLQKSLQIDERNHNDRRDESERERDARIDRMINEMERRRKELKVKELSFNSFYEFVGQEYRRWLRQKNVREKDFDLEGFLNVLEPYYRGGEYDYLLNSDREMDLLHKRFIVFELDNIRDNKTLLPIVTLIIMETFISKMRRLKGVRKMILIEECWKALASANMSEYIRYLFKTVRKYFGEAVVVTQEVDDIISSPIVKETIINNADCKILLDQRKYMTKFDGIQAMLGLSEKEKAQILSLNLARHPGRNYKEVWIGLGGVQSAVYAVEVSKSEYYTYTTEEREKTEIFALAERMGGDLEGAIRRMASERRTETPEMTIRTIIDNA